MMHRQFQNLLLRPDQIVPSREDMQVIGTFNPGAIEVGGEVVLLVRVAEKPIEGRTGMVALPRGDEAEKIAIDWIPEEEVEYIDPRVVRLRGSGHVRLTFLSHLRILRTGDGRSLDSVEGGWFEPHPPQEEYGVEDPRISRIEEKYYFTYVCVSRFGISTALASTVDFNRIDRLGVIFPPENKDVVLFPEKIDGDYVAIHRPWTQFSPPQMWLARSRDLTHWGSHAPIRMETNEWEAERVGAGPPPIKTPEGWLLLYHGRKSSPRPQEVGEYGAGLLLLDLKDPSKILAKSAEPFLTPEAEFEREGFVPNVVFPTGIVESDDSYLIYYGAADTYCGVVELSKDEVRSRLGI